MNGVLSLRGSVSKYAKLLSAPRSEIAFLYLTMGRESCILNGVGSPLVLDVSGVQGSFLCSCGDTTIETEAELRFNHD